jgi:hypothetical protein
MSLASVELLEPDIEVSVIKNDFEELVTLFFRDMTKYLNAAKTLKDVGLNPVKLGLDRVTDCYSLEFIINYNIFLN